MNGTFSLDGKRAIVTGANTGIGQAIAVGLAEAGASVVAAGRSSCAETVEQIKATGREGEALSAGSFGPQGRSGGARCGGRFRHPRQQRGHHSPGGLG